MAGAAGAAAVSSASALGFFDVFCFFGFAAAPSPDGSSPGSPTRAITWPIGRVSPSAATISIRVPPASAS